MAPINFNVRVLLYREDDMWVAQCLEHDIAAQGKTLDEVQNKFHQTFIGQVILDLEAGKQPLKNVPKAPAEFLKMFENSSHRLKDPKPFPVSELPPAYMVNAIAEEAIYA